MRPTSPRRPQTAPPPSLAATRPPPSPHPLAPTSTLSVCLPCRRSLSSSRCRRRCCTALAGQSRSCPLCHYVTRQDQEHRPCATDLALLGLSFSVRPWPRGTASVGGSWGQSSVPDRRKCQRCGKGSTPFGKPSAVGRRTTSHRARSGHYSRLRTGNEPLVPKSPSSGPWCASAALTLRVCLHACRVISGSLSGLSPYDRD